MTLILSGMGRHRIHELYDFTPAMAPLTALKSHTPDYTRLILSSCLLRVVQNSAYFSSLSMCDIIKLVWQAGYLVHVFIGWRSEVWNWIWLWRSKTIRAMVKSGVQGGCREPTSNALIWTNNVWQEWITRNVGETMDDSKTESSSFGSHFKGNLEIVEHYKVNVPS